MRVSDIMSRYRGLVSEKRAESWEEEERAEQGKVEKERGAINGQGQGEDGGGRGVGEGEEKDTPLQLCLNSDYERD